VVERADVVVRAPAAPVTEPLADVAKGFHPGFPALIGTFMNWVSAG
jgi:hypothetical protein